MLWIVVVVFFALVLMANYLVLRSRPADRDAIAAFVASAGVEQVSLRRGLLRMGDGADGKTGLSAWTAPSRAARIYVLITRDRNGELCRWRIAIDPWARTSSMTVLSRRQLPSPH